MAQGVLRNLAARAPAGGRHHRHGLARPGVALHPADPVERVFQHAGNRLVIFGGGNDHGIRFGNLRMKPLHGCGDAISDFNIAIIKRQAQVGELEAGRFEQLFGGMNEFGV